MIRLAGITALVILACGGYWSVRLTIADQLAREGSSGSLQRAIQLAPGNSEYLRLADVDLGSALAVVEKAAELNHRNSSV